MNLALVLVAALTTAWAAREARRGKAIPLYVILAVGLLGSLANLAGIFR